MGVQSRAVTPCSLLYTTCPPKTISYVASFPYRKIYKRRTVHGVAGRAPKFVLLEGVKQGGEGLHWLPPLVLRNEDGSFSGEWHRIYGY